MLQQWLSRMETVHVARTRQEREAIYRFRYQVYFEEFGRELGCPDHTKRWVTDDDDECATTTLLYTGSVDHMTGTVRLRHWQPGQVPQHDIEELSMNRFPDLAQRHTAEIGRLMVRPSLRGKLIMASLVRASYQHLVGQHDAELVFCYCSPGLVRFYQHIAMRPYGGRLIAAPDGLMVPMVSVTSDVDYYRLTGSFLASMVGDYFGCGKRKPVDVDAYRSILHHDVGIDLEARSLGREVENLRRQDPDHPLLTAIPQDAWAEILERSMILDVDADIMVTRRGFREQELFLVLEGELTAGDDSNSTGSTATIRAGELFGEDAFLHPKKRRTASIRARQHCRLLVLCGRSVDKLLRRRPKLAVPVLRYLAGLLAQRLAHTIDETNGGLNEGNSPDRAAVAA